MKEIYLFHDLRFGGGAELSALYLLGMKPSELRVRPTHDMADAKSTPAAIVSGVEFFQRRHGIYTMQKLWENRVPYVVWDHHVGIGNFHPSDWKRLFSRARLIMFMSPLHRFWREKNFGDSIDPDKVAVLPVGMDPSSFKPMGFHRRRRAICMMTRMASKRHSVWNYARANPEKPIHVFSDVDSPGLNNVFIHKARPREVLPGIYNRAMWHVDLPGRPTAGGNASYEAAMCGCIPIVNDNVGSASWPWFHDGPEAVAREMEAGNHRFWQLVGNELGA